MSEPLARYFDARQAGDELARLAQQLGADEFVAVRNLEYVFAPCELYPLAPRVEPPLDRIVAFAIDMDGTSTTTEPLALHALEYMVRRLTGRMSRTQWAGLDPQADHPHVIGNSNYRHTEFLLQRYRQWIDHDALREAFFEALCWTLAVLDDPQRHEAVRQTARKCGLAALLDDQHFRHIVADPTIDEADVARRVAPLITRYGSAFDVSHFGQLVSAALDVYYLRYHSILHQIERDGGERLSRELLGDSGRRLIEPMPGYEVFLPLVKGWLGAEAAELVELLLDCAPARITEKADTGELRRKLAALGAYFARSPARLALVTASIPYEAHVSMKEVIAEVARRVADWPISDSRRQAIVAHLGDYRAVFDAFITAGEACEHRLKPHRDLYSLALAQMGVPRQQWPHCVGLEDTEPGIIALRAAGVGCAVALPNRDTAGQTYRAAVRVITGGLPVLILEHNLLLAPAALEPA